MKLGTWSLGSSAVSLEVDETPGYTGGSYDFESQSIRLHTFNLSWPSVVAVLLHEVLEYLLHAAGRSFVRADDLLCAADCRTFVLTHAEFTVTCSHAATWLAQALPALSEWLAEARKEARYAQESAQA